MFPAEAGTKCQMAAISSGLTFSRQPCDLRCHPAICCTCNQCEWALVQSGLKVPGHACRPCLSRVRRRCSTRCCRGPRPQRASAGSRPSAQLLSGASLTAWSGEAEAKRSLSSRPERSGSIHLPLNWQGEPQACQPSSRSVHTCCRGCQPVSLGHWLHRV